MDAQEAFGISAPCQVIANACASGTNAIGHAFECIRSGRYQRVSPAVTMRISELVFVGFDSLQASTPEKCRPFDASARGMVLGEGAAHSRARKSRSGTKRAAQRFWLNHRLRHLDRQSSPHPARSRPASDRARRWNALCAARNLQADAIDYINAHGTATPFNDAAEGKAIAELFD